MNVASAAGVLTEIGSSGVFGHEAWGCRSRGVAVGDVPEEGDSLFVRLSGGGDDAVSGSRRSGDQFLQMSAWRWSMSPSVCSRGFVGRGPDSVASRGGGVLHVQDAGLRPLAEEFRARSTRRLSGRWRRPARTSALDPARRRRDRCRQDAVPAERPLRGGLEMDCSGAGRKP